MDAQRLKVDGFEECNEYASKILDAHGKSMDKVGLDLPEKVIKKRIFLLTDGQVSDSHEVVKQASLLNEVTRVHTFGIGEGCDKTMVIETANAGRGSYSMV